MPNAFLPRTVFSPCAILLAALVFLLSVAATEAQTIAHWRFESGDFLTDSSGNGRTLSTVTGHSNSTQVQQYALPATGAGSAFYDPIPLSGAANGQAFGKGIDGNGGYLTAADNSAFTSSTLTLEAMVHFATRTTSLAFLAGHFDGGSNQRSYALIGSGTGTDTIHNKLAFAVSSTGPATGSTVYYSDFNITTGVDYYFAVAMDLTGATAAERSLTFYYRNLTAGGDLLSQTITGITQASLHNSTVPFAIGAQGGGGSHAAWSGLIDEVRLSNVVLSSDQLLAVPEPSTALVVLGSLMAGAFFRRRRRM